MANTFNRTTKASLSTGSVTSDAATNVLDVSTALAFTLISVLISNKLGSSATADVYLVTASGDDVYLVKGAPVPSGSTLELVQGNRIVLTTGDVIRASFNTSSALDITLSYLEQT